MTPAESVRGLSQSPATRFSLHDRPHPKTMAVELRQGKDIDEAPVGQDAEQGMTRELGGCRRGTREPAEETGSLAGRSERRWVLGRQCVEDGAVEFEVRGQGRRRNDLGRPGQAIRTVAAWLGTGFAEVADERLHLAAIVFDEGDDSLDPLGL